MNLSRWILLVVVTTATLCGMTQHVDAEAYDVYILTGQSNSLGTTRFDGDQAQDYGPGQADIDKEIAFFWSNVHASNRAYPPKLYGDSGGEIVTLRIQQGDGGQNPAFWGPEFGLARAIAGRSENKVLIIKASRGGGGNGYWDKGTYSKDKNIGHMWQHLCDTTDAALNVLAKRGDTFDVKGLVYIQGESNSSQEAAVAGQRLADLHANLQDHLNDQHNNAAASMRLVVGEIAASQNAKARRQTTQKQQELVEADPAFMFVRTRDLPLQPDKIHFGKKAKLEIGNRVAQAFQSLELIEQQRELVSQAQTIIKDWRVSDGDVKADRPLIITLFTGSDTEPAPKYRERLTRTMQHIQSFYADEMDRHGFGPMTFGLQYEEDDLLKIHVVRGDQPNDKYSGKDGKAIRAKALEHLKQQGIDGNKQTVVIFCNLTKWDSKTRRMSHHSPYYAGGSHQAGTAWQLDSALLDVAELSNTDKDAFLHDGQYGNISLGRYQSIFVGGICHELGHALGLPHNKQRPDEQTLWGTALMGSGNRTYGEEVRGESKGSFLTLTHALKLASHPSFSGSVKKMRARPNSKYVELSVEPVGDGKGLRVNGKVQSDIPVYAVLAYLDPEGGSDYNATTHATVPDKQGRFSIDCTSFAGKKGRLRLVRIHANGWSRFSEDIGMDYERDEAGQVTVTPPRLEQQRAAIDGGSMPPSSVMCPCCMGRGYQTPPTYP